MEGKNVTFIDEFKNLCNSNEEDLIPFERTKIDCCKKSMISCQICGQNPSHYTCPKWYLLFIIKRNSFYNIMLKFTTHVFSYLF